VGMCVSVYPLIVVRQRLDKIPLMVARQLCKNPLIIARQRLGKNLLIGGRKPLGRNVTTVTNTHATIEKGDASFSMWSVSYKRK
jgi:hypothetical protein